MFSLKITNLPDAIPLAREWATHVVSILDPELFRYPDMFEIPQAGEGVKMRRFYFHDVEKLDDAVFEFKQLASKQQLQEILTFTAKLKDHDRLLIHCHAGISRSTAVATGILSQYMHPKDAIREVYAIRPIASPNRLIIELIDELLIFDGDLISACQM